MRLCLGAEAWLSGLWVVRWLDRWNQRIYIASMYEAMEGRPLTLSDVVPWFVRPIDDASSTIRPLPIQIGTSGPARSEE